MIAAFLQLPGVSRCRGVRVLSRCTSAVKKCIQVKSVSLLHHHRPACIDCSPLTGHCCSSPLQLLHPRALLALLLFGGVSRGSEKSSSVPSPGAGDCGPGPPTQDIRYQSPCLLRVNVVAFHSLTAREREIGQFPSVNCVFFSQPKGWNSLLLGTVDPRSLL